METRRRGSRRLCAAARPPGDERCAGSNRAVAQPGRRRPLSLAPDRGLAHRVAGLLHPGRSEEHTSELQSLTNLVCRLLLEKKKNNKYPHLSSTKKNKN